MSWDVEDLEDCLSLLQVDPNVLLQIPTPQGLIHHHSHQLSHQVDPFRAAQLSVPCECGRSEPSKTALFASKLPKDLLHLLYGFPGSHLPRRPPSLGQPSLPAE